MYYIVAFFDYRYVYKIDVDIIVSFVSVELERIQIVAVYEWVGGYLIVLVE